VPEETLTSSGALTLRRTGAGNRLHQQDGLRAAECGAISRGQGYRALALDLQEALQALGEITGETTPDDVLAAIFGSFASEVATRLSRDKKRSDPRTIQTSAEGETPLVALTKPILPQASEIGK
jgi:hypothetical protein